MLREIFLIHHTHMDIGYTDLPTEVLDQHLDHMDRAIELCEAGARTGRPYFWTCESAYLVRDYLECRPAGQRERLLNALRQGWIELQCMLTQPLTELPSGEELIDNVAWATKLGRKEGFPVECAMICDIGGYTGRLPTILNGLGVRYLVAGVGAFQVHLPWASLPHLFYLEDKAGARVLVWNVGIDRRITPQEMTRLDATYGLGFTYLVGPYKAELLQQDDRGVELDVARQQPPPEPAREKLAQLDQRLSEEAYPYEEAMLQYGGDNRGPDADLTELLARMADIKDLPQIRLTTPRHFLRHMESAHGDSIPVLKGVITDPWTVRANPTPSGLKSFRKAQRLLEVAEARRALLPDPAERTEVQPRFNDLYHLDHLYADHTCGLSEWNWRQQFTSADGCRDAAFDRYRRSWAIKRSYAEGALRAAEALERRFRRKLGAGRGCDGDTIVVWNDLPRSLAGPAELYSRRDAPALAGLCDVNTGESVPFQALGPNRYVISSPPVPGLGFRRLRPEWSRTEAPLPAHRCSGTSLMENEFLRVTLDPSRACIGSVIDKRSGREWLEHGEGLGEFIYQRVHDVNTGAEQAGMNPLRLERLPITADAVSTVISGDVASSCSMEGHVDGPAGPVRFSLDVRLYNELPRLDLCLRLDKPETERKESCNVAFPFAVRDPVFAFDQNVGWIQPGVDLLPGAMQDAFYCYSWANVSDRENGVTVAAPDAPVFQFGRIRTGAWERDLPFEPGSGRLYSWLYHNLLNTDAPIWCNVLDTFHFGIVFHDTPFAPGTAMATADEITRPLHAELCRGVSSREADEQTEGGLVVHPESVRLHAVRALGPEAILVRIEDTSGQPTRASIRFHAKVRDAQQTPLSGDKGQSLVTDKDTVRIGLQPFELATVRAELH